MAETTGTTAPESIAEQGDEGVRRRDFINIAAISAAGVGGVAVVYPLVSQMSPSADVLAESTTEVDVSAIEAGQSIKAIFRKQPLFIKRLTAAEIAEANGLKALPSATNFVAIDCGQDGAFAKRVLDALIEQGLFVRMPFVEPQNRCIRISAGPEAEMELFCKALPIALARARES